MRWTRVVPLLALVAGAGACDNGLTDVNRNPNAPEVVPATNLLLGGIWDVVANAANRGVFGYWTTFYHMEIWAQHLAQSQYNDEDRYIPRAGLNDNIWSEMYAALLDLDGVKEMALEEGDDNLWAVAEIMSAYGFLFLADTFGDIPYSEALRLDEGISAPAYDPQAEIYSDLLARLEEAANRIDPTAEVSFEIGDLIYEGNLQDWRKFANSLRLRVAMRVADTELSDQAAQAFAAAWSAPRFQSVEDAADLDWNGTQPAQNPVYENIVLAGRPGDFRVSASLIDMLTELGDPRLPIYADPAVSDGAFRGLPNGREPTSLGRTLNDFSMIGKKFVEPDAPSVLMSYAEVLFLGAEAAERGWIGGDPAALYAEAITASMQEHGVPASQITSYLASSPYQGLESIWLQKWIALYLAGPEGFNEYRRTKVPDLQPAFGGVINEIPSRLEYPEDEALYNPTNFAPYAGTALTDALWWMRR